jgi:nicotinate-nucleotide adenylyltransferase
MRRGVFGGSFDPVHTGHLTVAAAAADRLELDRLHFVPALTQPFKARFHHAEPADRVAMLRLALEDRRFVLDTREIEREGVSYTVDTLREMRAEFPEDRLSLLIGADAARDLPGWREAGAIAELARVVVLTRPGVEPPAHVWVAEVVEVPAVDVSASEIRARVARSETIEGMVPVSVAEYIESHRLYRTGD